MTRREWMIAAGAAALPGANARVARNHVAEFVLFSTKAYTDPFNEIELDAVFRSPEGRELRVPAFWAGGQSWRVRFASHQTGAWSYRTECTDTTNQSLHGVTGAVTVADGPESNPLLKHGAIRVSGNGRHFEHEDGTTFFFLADDWWLGMTSRLRFPGEFRTLAEDRVRKGYTAIKLVAGLTTDTTEFDPRSANEGGLPWEPGYKRIRPGFFDAADQRIRMLVDLGLSPSVVGSWGFYLKSMGTSKMFRHWRYCVARWGAYPVTWYLALENDLPYYLSKTGTEDTARAQVEWTEIGQYLKKIDPFKRPITMQSWSTRDSALGGLTAPAILDFDSLHMGHQDRDSATNCIRVVKKLYHRTPAMPVIPGEVTFEGIGWQNWSNIQRLVFWGSMLNGASGFCYGANGIWQFNRKGDPFGDSPHDRTWGGDDWETAMNYPGSRQVGLGKKLLANYAFWKLEPHSEWVEPRPREQEGLPPFAAGIPGELRLVYLPLGFGSNLRVRRLEPGTRYKAFWFDPVSGERRPAGEAAGDGAGDWSIPAMPGVWDHLLVLERLR